MTFKSLKILFFCTCWLVFSCQSNDLIVKDLTQKKIPDNLIYKGSLIEAKKWSDKNGVNILIISRYGPYRTTDPYSTGNEFGNVELYAYQYLVNNQSIVQLWESSEIIKDCPTDMWIEVFPNSTSITDLDNNGVTETTIVHRYSCRGGLDPSNMKVILHEGKQSYCLQGEMYLDYQKGQIDKTTFEFNLSKISNANESMGRYINDLEFTNAPPEFLTFSTAKWIEYCDKDSIKQFYRTDYQQSEIEDKHKP